MKVFKFGGASVKDVEGVKNVVNILQRYPNEKLIVVVSAMGKTTNALEKVVRATTSEEAEKLIKEIEAYHYQVAEGCIRTSLTKQNITYTLNKTFALLRKVVAEYPKEPFDERYDQVVSFGEHISVLIVCACLSDKQIPNMWMRAQNIIHTDSNYREGKVDFEKTLANYKKFMPEAFELVDILVMEGFVGSTATGKTTTLGREGSDYTAAIMAYCANAESVTIWKDVPGVLNADPKWFDNTIKIDHLSYQDAIELAYYGATVIHPKTIKPLQNKNIPLFVRSFLQPDAPGTRIDNDTSQLPVPCFIFKVQQVLISLSPKDFSFIVEENLSRIFDILAQYKVKTNVMQNSAINFSLCLDFDPDKVPALIEALRSDFRVLYNKDLELVTIRYYDQPTIDRVSIEKRVLLEHKSRYTVQIVMQNK